jgi:GTP-binding protein HflX
MAAFKSTLEELEDADLLLHVVDVSNPRFQQHIESVERILSDLHLDDKKRVLVFNKADRLGRDESRNITDRFGGTAVSALDRTTFKPLLAAIERNIFDEKLMDSRV